MQGEVSGQALKPGREGLKPRPRPSQGWTQGTHKAQEPAPRQVGTIYANYVKYATLGTPMGSLWPSRIGNRAPAEAGLRLLGHAPTGPFACHLLPAQHGACFSPAPASPRAVPGPFFPFAGVPTPGFPLPAECPLCSMALWTPLATQVSPFTPRCLTGWSPGVTQTCPWNSLAQGSLTLTVACTSHTGRWVQRAHLFRPHNRLTLSTPRRSSEVTPRPSRSLPRAVPVPLSQGALMLHLPTGGLLRSRSTSLAQASGAWVALDSPGPSPGQL